MKKIIISVTLNKVHASQTMLRRLVTKQRFAVPYAASESEYSCSHRARHKLRI